MPKRRRVDLSLRLEEAKAVAHLLGLGMLEAGSVGVTVERGYRVQQRLLAGIKYVTEVNPTHRRPSGAKARTP